MRAIHAIKICSLLLAGLPPCAFGLEEIGGDLPATVTAAHSPYLAVSDLYVPAGRTVLIEPGVVFLFRNFTGLKVQGILQARGTADKPVVFTSEFDHDYRPDAPMKANAYDWNGMYIDKDAIGTELEHVAVNYSVYGLTSMTKFLRLKNGTFRENGRGNFSVEGVEHPVTGRPYSYNLSIRDATVDGVPVKILKDPLAVRRNVLRYAGAVVFVGGCGLGVFYQNYWSQAQDELDLRSGTDLPNLVGYSDPDWRHALDNRNLNRVLSLAGYGVALIGAAGFAWSFTF